MKESETDELMLQYDPWIRKVTRKMWLKFGKRYEFEDLLSVAYIASLESISTYDDRKAKFSVYIRPRIEGAITRSVSTISNKQHGLFTSMLKFIDNYIEEHNRIPAQHIIIKHLSLNENQFLSLLEATQKRTIISPDDVPEEDLAFEVDVDRLAEYSKVMDIVNTLPLRQQKIIENFMDDGVMSGAVKDILVILRNRLNIKEIEDD